MATQPDQKPAEFVDADLSGAQFLRTDLSGAVLRDVDLSDAVIREASVDGAEIDAPWLSNSDTSFLVNGVDVKPFVEAELNRRFPGRDERRAQDPQGLRSAWAALERSWESTLERVEAMPSGTVNVSVADEWSFAQTLRHLVFATDVWLGRAILEIKQPFHTIGLRGSVDDEDDEPDLPTFRKDTPPYEEVREARAARVAMVRDFLASVTVDELATKRAHPWGSDDPETTLSCLQVILEEEWEHHRYAVRDLDTISDS